MWAAVPGCVHGPVLFTCMLLDENMTPSGMTIDYNVSSFLHLHSDFLYNSFGSTCTYHYLLVGTNVSQSASPSKLNFQFIGAPTILHSIVPVLTPRLYFRNAHENNKIMIFFL